MIRSQNKREIDNPPNNLQVATKNPIDDSKCNETFFKIKSSIFKDIEKLISSKYKSRKRLNHTIPIPKKVKRMEKVKVKK